MKTPTFPVFFAVLALLGGLANSHATAQTPRTGGYFRAQGVPQAADYELRPQAYAPNVAAPPIYHVRPGAALFLAPGVYRVTVRDAHGRILKQSIITVTIERIGTLSGPLPPGRIPPRVQRPHPPETPPARARRVLSREIVQRRKRKIRELHRKAWLSAGVAAVAMTSTLVIGFNLPATNGPCEPNHLCYRKEAQGIRELKLAGLGLSAVGAVLSITAALVLVGKASHLQQSINQGKHCRRCGGCRYRRHRRHRRLLSSHIRRESGHVPRTRPPCKRFLEDQ